MKSIFVITLTEAICIGVFAFVTIAGFFLWIRIAVRQYLCSHVELEPPATSFGGTGHGWRCIKCMKDFGWAKPKFTLFKGWTQEEQRAWLDKYGDDPEGCTVCGAIAGCCKDYPNCAGNPKWVKP